MKHKNKTHQRINSPASDFPAKDVWIVLGIYILLALIFYRKILSPSVMVYGSDWLAGSYQLRWFIKESLHNLGYIPQWVPHLYGGLPLFANVGDAYYPFSIVLRWLFPVHQYTAYLYITNTIVAGIFTYLFLKHIKLSFWPSLYGGLAYMFTGILISHVIAGHEGRMAIIAFLPVVLFLLSSALERQTLVSFIIAGLGLGFILLLPHVQMNYYLLIMCFFYFGFRTIQHCREKQSWLPAAKLTSFFVVFILVGFLVSAVVYLPFYKYVPFSPRGGEEGRGYEFATSWAMNPEETINMTIPEFSGSSVGEGTYWGRNFFKLHSEYLGAGVFLLAVLGLIHTRKKALTIFWL